MATRLIESSSTGGSGPRAGVYQLTPGDGRVALGALSVHAQCMSLMSSQIGERLMPGLKMTPSRLDEIAGHITRFSLAGIRQLAGAGPVASSRA